MSNLYPQLADCRTSDLKHVLSCIYPLPYGVAKGEDGKVWLAMALMLDDELRFRDRRRKPLVPRPPTPKRSKTR